MSLTTARMKAALDEGMTGVTHVQWSENGSSESGNLARTSLTNGVSAATTANPSVAGNGGAEESAGASAGCTITHFAFSGGTGGADLFTLWIPLDDSAVLLAGGKIILTAANDLKVNLYQATSAPA
jgi:hypothetical protein